MLFRLYLKGNPAQRGGLPRHRLGDTRAYPGCKYPTTRLEVRQGGGFRLPAMLYKPAHVTIEAPREDVYNF